MVQFEKIKKLNSISLSVKADLIKETLYISRKSFNKVIGIAIVLVGFISFLKAFFDLAITDGYGLAPTPFRLTIILGIVGLLIGWLIFGSKRPFSLTINFKDNTILLNRKDLKSSDPLEIKIRKTDRFELKEEKGKYFLFLTQEKDSIELFSFASEIKIENPYIKDDLIRELNNNIC